MAYEQAVREALPEIEEIEDEELREKVVKIWADAVDNTDFDGPEDLPWSSTFIPVVGEDETQVGHIRECTQLVIAFADVVAKTRPELEINRDYLIAGTLLHDISKFYEISPEEGGDRKTKLAKHLSHPHYGIHLLAEEDLPIELLNMVAAHTENTKVEPKTVEAKILESIDLLITDCVLHQNSGQFKWEVIDREPVYINKGSSESPS